MFRKGINCLLSIMLIYILNSCSTSSVEDNVVVSVGDAELTLSDLYLSMPQAESSKDSSAIADEYVRRWVQQQVIVQKAKEFLSDEELNINAAIEEYRTSLIVEVFQQKLLKQKFRAEVPDTAILRYYSDMKQNFKLNETIVKGLFAILSKETRGIKDFEKLIKQMDDNDFLATEQFLFKYSSKYDVFFDKWMPISSITKYIPSEVQKKGLQTLKKGTLVVLSDESNFYYLLPTEICLVDECAPLEYVKDKIYIILLNKEKVDFIKKMNFDLYNEAYRNNKIQYHAKK